MPSIEELLTILANAGLVFINASFVLVTQKVHWPDC